MTEDGPVMLCTVGGSHQPVLKAIKSAKPRFVCLFCTDRDPDTGKPGSIEHITGQGNVIKAQWSDTKPTLPSIPIQAGLEVDDYTTFTVLGDNLDEAYGVMRRAASEMAARFPGVSIVADYSGGTKTMTAALVCAALEREDTELQVVVGARADLIRVRDGTEQVTIANVARLRLDRAMSPYLAAWGRFAYHEAAEGLDRIRIAGDDAGKQRLRLARVMSTVFARWDDFDHAGALELLDCYAGRVSRCYPWMLPTLRCLVNKAERANEPALLWDLWRNAERRAAQGRFDDATARVYRLLEWTAQWQLRMKLDADTADFPQELLPTGIEARRDTNGKIKIGLWTAWQIVRERLQGPAADLITEHGSELRDLLSIRNDSILAHGFRPVGEHDWKQMENWIREKLLPVLKQLSDDAGLRRPPQQLPRKPSTIFHEGA